MDFENVVGVIALAWLIGALILMAQSIRRGRELAKTLATRHPEIYESLGRPRPGFLQSSRRDRFAQFIARREYQKLADPALTAQFEAYRKSDARLVVGLLASLVILALLVFAVRYAA